MPTVAVRLSVALTEALGRELAVAALSCGVGEDSGGVAVGLKGEE